MLYWGLESTGEHLGGKRGLQVFFCDVLYTHKEGCCQLQHPSVTGSEVFIFHTASRLTHRGCFFFV